MCTALVFRIRPDRPAAETCRANNDNDPTIALCTVVRRRREINSLEFGARGDGVKMSILNNTLKYGLLPRKRKLLYFFFFKNVFFCDELKITQKSKESITLRLSVFTSGLRVVVKTVVDYDARVATLLTIIRFPILYYTAGERFERARIVCIRTDVHETFEMFS